MRALQVAPPDSTSGGGGGGTEVTQLYQMCVHIWRGLEGGRGAWTQAHTPVYSRIVDGCV